MARKNRYDAPRRTAMGQPPPDDATEVTVRAGRGLLPVDDETNFGDSSRGSELEAELLKLDPRALAKRLAASASSDVHETTVRRPAVRRSIQELPEDQPTTIGPVPDVTSEPSVSIGAPLPIEDPASLARRLAAEAMARLKSPSPPSTRPAAPRPARPTADKPRRPAPRRAESRPTPKPAPPRRGPSRPKTSDTVSVDTQRPAPTRTDPRRRRSLVTAKPAPSRQRRAQRIPSPPPKEDPAALAQRLAEEAKARLKVQSPPVEPAVSGPDAATSVTNLADVLPAEASPRPERSPSVEAPAAVEPSPVIAPAPPPAAPAERPRSRLADRAPRIHKKKSAAEAVKHLSVEPAPQRSATPPLSARPASPAVPAPSPATPLKAPLAALQRVFPGAIIESEHAVTQVTVFKALWEAHQARAVRSGRLPLAAAATVLLAHVDAGRPLVAARIHCANQSWAAFCAADDGALLAVVDTPEIYLAGIR